MIPSLYHVRKGWVLARTSPTIFTSSLMQGEPVRIPVSSALVAASGVDASEASVPRGGRRDRRSSQGQSGQVDNRDGDPQCFAADIDSVPVEACCPDRDSRAAEGSVNRRRTCRT